MRLLFIQETDWLKRNPHQQHHLAEMLSLRGHEIRAIDYEFLWKTQSKREFYSRRKVLNVSKIHDGAKILLIRPGVIKIPFLDYASLVFSHQKEIGRQIEEFAPDVIIGWSILNSYLARRAANKSKIPFLYYLIDVLHRLIPFTPFQLIGKLIESKTLKQADRVLVINDKLKEYMIELGAPPERTQVLGAGIDTKQFNPTSNDEMIRKQYGFNKRDTVLFFMGWLYNFSGLKEVILQLAKTQNRDLKLLIVGEGDAYAELQRMREKHHLQDRLILTGEKPYQEIPHLIAASDICLLPAYPDEKIMQTVVPIKMYEYMAMKKAVIATRLPGVMKEFSEDNGVVYVDKPEDVIAKAIELVQNGSVTELGLKARESVERYSWDSITDEFEEILKEVVEEKRIGTISKRV